MKKRIIVILLFIFNLSFAHKDHIDIYKNKNINIRMISSYEYGDFNKLKIYGEYANKVAEFHNFKDTIYINFRFIIPFNSLGNEVMIEKFKYRDFKNINYLKIEINSSDLSIEKFSKIIDFAIKNKEKLNKHIVDKLDFHYETGNFHSKHKIINPETLENFYIIENSFIDKIDLNVEIFKNEIFSCFWKNNEYKYYQKEKAEPIFTIKDYELHSNQLTDFGLVIFPNNKEFFFINNNGKISKTHELECSNNVFCFQKRDNYFWVVSHYMGQYYYLPIEDKLLKQVN